MDDELNMKATACLIGSDGDGFRINYRNADHQGYFDDCKTIGDFALAYLDFMREQILIARGEVENGNM